MRHLAFVLCVVFLGACLAGCSPSVDEIRTNAISEYQVGHTKSADKLFNRVLEKRPADPVSLYYLGRMAHSDGQYERAKFLYESTIDADPSFRPQDPTDPGVKYWLKKAKADAGATGKTTILAPLEDKVLP